MHAFPLMACLGEDCWSGYINVGRQQFRVHVEFRAGRRPLADHGVVEMPCFSTCDQLRDVLRDHESHVLRLWRAALSVDGFLSDLVELIERIIQVLSLRSMHTRCGQFFSLRFPFSSVVNLFFIYLFICLFISFYYYC